MREAVSDGAVLRAPGVGRWRPEVGLGTPLTAGLRLGVLVRVGRELEVRAPVGASGVVVELAAAGAFVGWGDALVTAGEGGGALLTTAAPATVAGGPEGAVAVRVDTDGTVFLSPEPGAPTYVAEGGPVEAHATVALVEVMKTFTPVRAPVSGRVVRVDVRHGAAVSAGAAVLWIAPA